MGKHLPFYVDIYLVWNEAHKKYVCGEMTKEEYDLWRYNYPKPLVGDKNAPTKVVSMPMDFDFSEED